MYSWWWMVIFIDSNGISPNDRWWLVTKMFDDGEDWIWKLIENWLTVGNTDDRVMSFDGSDSDDCNDWIIQITNYFKGEQI